MTKEDYESRKRTLEAERVEALARRNAADIERRNKEKALRDLDAAFIRAMSTASEAKESGRKPR